MLTGKEEPEAHRSLQEYRPPRRIGLRMDPLGMEEQDIIQALVVGGEMAGGAEEVGAPPPQAGEALRMLSLRRLS